MGLIVISVELNDGISQIPTHALVDCGATGYACADEEFVRDHNLPLYKVTKPRTLEVIDGRPIEFGTTILHGLADHHVQVDHIFGYLREVRDLVTRHPEA